MKKKIITICAAVLFLTALGLTLYPLVSNYVNQKYASEIQTAYQELIQQTDDSVLQEAKQRAMTALRKCTESSTVAETVWPSRMILPTISCALWKFWTMTEISRARQICFPSVPFSPTRLSPLWIPPWKP